MAGLTTAVIHIVVGDVFHYCNCYRPDSFMEASETGASSKVPVPRKGKHFLQVKQGDEQEAQKVHDTTSEESCTLYVSNLDNTVKESDIEKMFKSCQGLKEVRCSKTVKIERSSYCVTRAT